MHCYTGTRLKNVPWQIMKDMKPLQSSEDTNPLQNMKGTPQPNYWTGFRVWKNSLTWPFIDILHNYNIILTKE